MKHHRLVCLCFVVTATILASCGVSSTQTRSPLGRFTARLDEGVPVLMDRYGVPGVSIALVVEGEPVWSGVYGYADPTDGRPMTRDVLLRVQSITKSATAWGVVNLVDEGLIGLDDPVTQHVATWDFPDAPYDWNEVTIRHLLSHSAGLPEGLYSELSPDGEMPRLHRALDGDAGAPPARPIDPPGSVFRYSNPGYVLLELLIEEVTDRDYAEYMEAEILAPLGMGNSTFVWSDEVEAAIATGHRATGEPVPVYRPAEDAPAAPSAHGTLYATAGDVARLIASGMPGPGDKPPGGGVLSAGSVSMMYTPVIATTGFYSLGTEAAALGHLVELLAGGEQALTHGGQGGGSYSWYHSVPETGDGIVILTNSERSLQLIADVLAWWTAWRGLGAVGLTRAVRWARGVVGALGLLALGLVVWLGWGVAVGRRAFAPLSRRAHVGRGLVGGLALLILGLWWGLGYGLARHFLPVFSVWLGVGLSAVVGALVLVTLFPRRLRPSARV